MIALQICSTEEWQAFLQIMKVKRAELLRFPYGTYVGRKMKGIDCIFYHSHATKTRSAGACQYAIDHWQPKRIIVFGSAGGVSPELNLTNIVLATCTEQYDCAEAMGAKKGFFYPMFTEKPDNDWMDLNLLPVTPHQGLIATGDKDVTSTIARELKKHKVLAADWESGAISHICRLNGIPCTIFRGISDIPERHEADPDIYRKNVPKVMDTLLKKILPALLSMKNL